MKLRVRRTMYSRISSRQSSAYSLFSKAARERTGHWWRRMNSVSPISRSTSPAESQVRVLVDEQPQLVGQIQVGLVVGRGRQQDAPALVALDVVLDGPVALALAVAQVVALVDDAPADSAAARAVPAAPG